MNHPLPVCRLERFRHLTEQRQRLLERHRTSRQTLGKGFAQDQLHDQERSTVVSFEPVDRGDVGMIQRSEQARLALEPRKPLPIRCQGFRKRLDGHCPVERRIAGAIDLAHPTPPDQRFDLVAAETDAGLDDHKSAAILDEHGLRSLPLRHERCTSPRGSRRSRRPSPKRLNPRTVTRIARPGAVESHMWLLR